MFGGALTSLSLNIVNCKEVNDPGGEVKGDVVFVLLNGQAVPVAVAGSGHPAAVQQHR